MRWLKICGALVLLVLAAGLTAPYISADSYGKGLRSSLERALGRRVEVRGAVRFNLFKGPGLSAEDVVIHEDPLIGFEPIAYVGKIEVRPSFLSLVEHRFIIASIRLEDAHITLTKSAAGLWNFASFVDRSVMSTAPAIHIRGGRINFKTAITKSVFYLMDTDVDISPPVSRSGGWSVSCEGQAARADEPARGLGSFTLKGKWWISPERVDLDVRMDRAELGELAVLMSGDAGGVHGTVTSRLHLAGPIDGIGILGRATIEDVHRWDLLPGRGDGWPMDIRGRIDLAHQNIEVQSTSSVVPVTTYFRASSYLSQPHWAVTMTWNRFPVGAVLQLARDMGAQFPPRFQMNGTIDGAIGYSPQGGIGGELVLHDTAVAIPDSPPVKFEQVQLVLDHGTIRLTPAIVHVSGQDEARIEGQYSMNDGGLDLSISTDGMKVESLRAQASLAAVPWLEHVNSGTWSDHLQYSVHGDSAGWSGTVDLADAQVAVPGLADPLHIDSARATIEGPRVSVDRLTAQAGAAEFSGDYRYDPAAARPHRLRIRTSHLNASDLEAELMPTLRRSTSLLARAFGRASLPQWLRERKLEGTVQIGELELAGSHLQNVRTRLLWDASRVELADLQARLGRAAIEATLTVALTGQRPAYTVMGNVKSLDWQSGRIDAEGTLETSGTGSELLAHLTSSGTFTTGGMEFGALSGGYALSWPQSVPRLRLTDLSLRTEDATYIGSGATQDDGRLLILLSNGNKEMRMSGTLAAVKVDDAAPGPRTAQ